MIETTKRWADRRRGVLGRLENVTMRPNTPRPAPVPGEQWQHYGGTVFEVVGTATHSRTLEEQVLYRDPVAGDRGRVWACSLSTFLGCHKGGTHRFKRMPDAPAGAEEEAEWDALFVALGGKRRPQMERA